MTAQAAPDEATRHTVDAFHRGRFVLVQPARGAHRAGMDAMMLGASVPSAFAGRLADFGAGAGAAGLAVLSRCAGAKAVLVERAPEMVAFAQATLAHPDNAPLAGRAEILQADVALTGTARQAAGLADNSFDFVIMNPPFNAGADRATPDELKRQAHVMEDGLFESWLRSAAAVARPRGGVSVIARPESLPVLLDALRGRFGNAELMAIQPREDAAAIRIVVRAVRGGRGKLVMRPPLVLHETGSDRFRQNTDSINGGLPTHQIFRRGVVQISQARNLFPDMSVGENLSLGMANCPRSIDRAERMRRAYEWFPKLWPKRHLRAQSLSGGEQQMIAIGRALVSDPTLILLDEPSGGLAPRVVDEIAEILIKLKAAKHTMLIVEQNIALARSVADRFYILREGEVIDGDSVVNGARSMEEIVRAVYL